MLKNNFTSLKNFNTFGFDIQAKNLLVIKSEADLINNFKADNINLSSKIISGGSNILFTHDVDELLLKNEIEGIEIVAETDETVDISFGSGENWHNIVLYCVNNNWGGLENLSLIPGCVGASPIQNIGAYGSEIKDTFQWLRAFNLKTGDFEIFNHAQCNFGYRDSYFKNEGKNLYFITQVCFRLSKNPKINVQYGDIQAILDQKGIAHPTIKNVSDAVIEIRQSKLPDPAVLGNCGSFFKNPVISLSHFEKIKENHPSIKSFPVSETEIKVPAGWLIEQAGWKGKKVGNVGVHEKQALVLVNYGQGTGLEIKNLAESIQKDILEKFSISLEIEVNIW